MLAIKGPAGVRRARRPGRGKSLPVVWVDIAGPDTRRGRRRPRGLPPGPARGRGALRAARGLLGGEAAFLRLHERRRHARTATSTPTATARATARSGSTGRAGAPAASCILHYESPGGEALDSPDNLAVTPRGGLRSYTRTTPSTAVVDTDQGANGIEQRQPPDRDHAPRQGVRLRRSTFYSGSELAGVSSRPDGDTMFVNLYGASTGTPRRAQR